MELVLENTGGNPGVAVRGGALPEMLLDAGHDDFLQALSQIAGVIADEPVIKVYIGAVIDIGQAAGNVDLHRRGQVIRPWVVLCQQAVVEVTQDGHFLRYRVFQVFPVHKADAPVNERAFNGPQWVSLTGDHQLAQGHDEVCLHQHGGFPDVRGQVEVKRVDVAAASWRQVDDLPMKLLGQRCILVFRVLDENMVWGRKESVEDLALCDEGFAAARRSQHDTVGAFQRLAVCNDDMSGLCVQPVIQAARLKHLAGTEGKEDCGAAGSKPALHLYLVDAQRQRRHIALLLLVVQTDKVAVVGAGHAVYRMDNILQLLLCGCDVYQQNRHHEQLFIVVLQVLQQLFRLLAEGHEVGRKNVHIEAGTHGPLLFVDLGLIQVTQLPLDRFQRRALIQRLGVDADDLAGVGIQQRVQKGIVNFGGPDLQEGDRAHGRACPEIPALPEQEGAGRDIVLAAQAGTVEGFPIKAELLRLLQMQAAVQQYQPFIAIHSVGLTADALKAQENVCLHL